MILCSPSPGTSEPLKTTSNEDDDDDQDPSATFDRRNFRSRRPTRAMNSVPGVMQFESNKFVFLAAASESSSALFFGLASRADAKRRDRC